MTTANSFDGDLMSVRVVHTRKYAVPSIQCNLSTNFSVHNFLTIYLAKTRRGRRSPLRRRRRRTPTRLLSATLPRQGSTCVTHELSKLRDLRSRLGSNARSHADYCANTGQRTYSSKAPTVRACHQRGVYTDGGIGSLTAKLAYVRFLPSLILLACSLRVWDLTLRFVQSRLHHHALPKLRLVRLPS